MVGRARRKRSETWVKKLGDPIQRPAAIKRLIQFFEDAMTRANKDRNDANVKALLDKIIEPLTKTYVDGDLDERTRIELIKFWPTHATYAPRPPGSRRNGFAEGKGARRTTWWVALRDWRDQARRWRVGTGQPS
jgi:hypothetical protein